MKILTDRLIERQTDKVAATQETTTPRPHAHTATRPAWPTQRHPRPVRRRQGLCGIERNQGCWPKRDGAKARSSASLAPRLKIRTSLAPQLKNRASLAPRRHGAVSPCVLSGGACRYGDATGGRSDCRRPAPGSSRAGQLLNHQSVVAGTGGWRPVVRGPGPGAPPGKTAPSQAAPFRCYGTERADFGWLGYVHRNTDAASAVRLH